MFLYFLNNFVNIASRPGTQITWNIFVRKVDLRLRPRTDLDQPGAPILVDRRKGPAILPKRLDALSRRLRINEILQRLGLREVEFTVFNCAAGELPRLSGPTARDFPEGGEQARDDGASAMDVKLEHVFAAEPRGPRTPQHQRLI